MKWIEIIERPSPKLKTKIFKVFNKETLHQLGEIKWYAPWRKYSFFPANHLVFESTCMDDISRFMKQLMEERKPKK